MLIREKEKLGELVKRTAATLDIPDYIYEDAILKYEDIGSWLAAENSELKPCSPEIYPQGSFRLGTVVRPVSEKDEYDIDSVCHLKLSKAQTTQKNLKQIVGDRLKKRDDLSEILEPMRRCWRLNYLPEAQGLHFHMDVLPAIPNQKRPPTGILVTDTELTEWKESNPQAYSDWFFERMKVVLLAEKEILAKSIEASVEEVPNWRVKTPLQVAIQILKRHRDIYFQNDVENKPVSIIITTLAAHAYNNQADIYAALTDIVQDMPRFIGEKDGRWWVTNPVDPNENFADKWNEYPERHKAFERWLDKVRNDFLVIGQKQTLKEAIDFLAPALGEKAMTKAAADLGLQPSSNLPISITPETQVPALGSTQHCRPLDWGLKEKYKAKIIGSVHRKGPGKQPWALTNRSVPKNVILRFEVKTRTPPPYEVKWQVVNTGKEATEAGQLRGDFYDSDELGTNVRWEPTAYNGTHWIQAFIIKDGVCVAKSDPKIVRVRR
jgi:hypothetical protein